MECFLYGMLAGIGLVGVCLIITIIVVSRPTKINDKEWEA